jgi:hypothetical protein
VHPKKRILLQFILAGSLVWLLAACAPSIQPANLPVETSTEIRTQPSPFPLPATQAPQLPTATPMPPTNWQDLPVIPETLSDRMREVFNAGQELGNDPKVFARIGDCTSAAPGFLTGFDGNYNLGQYTSLQPVIDYFEGSFGLSSIAAKAGLNSSGLLSTLWTDAQCKVNETLLDCQYRLDKPAFAIISIGANEVYYVHRDPAAFETNMRRVIEDTLAKGIIPILGTKADNYEGDFFINTTIARLAKEFQVPLWNFWRAADPLPNHGLEDETHLSSISYLNFTDFSNPQSMNYGMQVRNLTALQMLGFVAQQLGLIESLPTLSPLLPTP